MKNKILLFTFSFFVSYSLQLKSQDNICESSYMPFKEGTSFEITNYNKKGKEVGKSRQKVASLENLNDGFKANVDLETMNDKGKTMHQGKYTMECRDGNIYLDVSSMLDPQAMAGFGNMEMELSGTALEIPNRLSVGQTLPDGTMEMKGKTGGMTLFNMSLYITNRKVDGQETITTPAGTFECMKILQDTEMKAIIRKKFKSATWYAKGVGMVKTENYDDKGNVESSSLLTKLER